MAVAPGRKWAMPDSQITGSDLSTSGVQAFVLRRQKRPREPYLVSPEQVRARTHPRGWQKRPDFNVRRQASRTTTAPASTTAPPNPLSTVTVTSSLTFSPPGTVVIVISPSPTFIPVTVGSVPPLQLPGSPTENSQSIITVTQTTLPGTIQGQGGTPIVLPSTSSHSADFPTDTSPAFAEGSPSRNSRARVVAIVVGSVVGGLIVVLSLLFLLLRWRRRRRRTGPILLADPFSDIRSPTSIVMPQPSAFGAAMLAGSSDASSPNPLPAKLSNLYPPESQNRQDSVTTNSPGPSTSQQDTMVEIQALRQRILEVENIALRQRIVDIENVSRGRQDTAEDTSAARVVDRVSESPPEYASPVEESQPPPHR
ncbi:hypothetical protein BDN70DRAFT_387830 [Pholiota conissans]|uniref:Transmembrane protein n=1 Tax=Pholiota conissans TaxID=109636 RepID=A0A9P6CXA6_9AGAR|nr:hypothetical protein BDN70DRAFT_387830 [Pholiota conissans]